MTLSEGPIPGDGGGADGAVPRGPAPPARAMAFIERIRRVVGRLFRSTKWTLRGVGVAAERAAPLVTLIAAYLSLVPPAPVPAAPSPARGAASLGRTVIDDGRAFAVGGSSRFTVAVDRTNTGVRVIRRLDAGIALQTATITVNGVTAGLWQPLPLESTYRWKDESVDLPPRLTAGRRSLTIVNRFVASEQDFNEFTYVIAQRVNGVWSRADIVDIGPAHSAEEAAHHYRIVGQTWAGIRSFKYQR